MSAEDPRSRLVLFRPCHRARLVAGLLLAVAALGSSCARKDGPATAGTPPAGGEEKAASGLDPVVEMNRGVGLLEQYQYLDAFKVFESLAALYPAWEAAHINQGVAAFNLQEEKYLKIAEQCFARALEVNPRSPHALVSLGILFNYTQRLDQALEALQKAVAIDPLDPHSSYHLAVCLADKGRADEARAALERVVKLQPSFASAHYRLRELYRKGGKMEASKAATAEFVRLNEGKVGVLVGNKYGENGKYNLAIRGSAPSGYRGAVPTWTPPASPSLGPAVQISTRPAAERRRPDGGVLPPAFAVGDLTGDGACEVVLCGERGEGEAAPGETVIYGRDGKGPYRQLEKLPMDSVVCALGDLDSDGDPDLVLAGDGWLRFLENDGSGKLAEKPPKVEGENHAGFPVRLYLVDADSDWDLDVLCLRQEAVPAGAGSGARSRLEVLNNNRDGTYREISPQCGIGPFEFPAVECLVVDLDEDVDPDIVVFDGSSGALHIFENERIWRYRKKDGVSAKAPGIFQVAVGDLDGDTDADMVLLCGDTLRLWRNLGGLSFEEDASFGSRFGGLGGTVGILADFQGAMRLGLLVLDAKSEVGAGAVFIPSPDADKAIPVSFEQGATPRGTSALATVLAREGPADLVIRDASAGARAHAFQPGAGWIALVLEGSKNPIPEKERANLSAIGAVGEVRVGGQKLVLRTDSGTGGTARAPGRLYFGLADRGAVDQVRVLWPDAVVQSELGLVGGKVHQIKEIERKPTSCPVLFAWDGREHAFIGDFLGVGGLGYFELPGSYSKPDPSEYLLLPGLQPLDGHYRLEILEPMEECAYLDSIQLTVVDHPEDVTVVPEEMFAVKGPAPGFRLLGLRGKVDPVKARNDKGADVTQALRHVDRRYAGEVDRDARFPGLARAVHWIELDFGEGVASVLARSEKGAARPYLVLHGFVEYGYSTSNFAAWQAREVFRAPTVRARRGGDWVSLREEWGFPAGFPRYMTVDLAGCLRATDSVLRVETNMDIHWDQAFLACSDAEDLLRVLDLQADAALLAFKGFPPEESRDGSIPRTYAYRDFEPTAQMKVFPGNYTRYGEVRELLRAPDDRFAILGPGDGLSFLVDARRLPPVAAGLRRTFLAKTFGYCKDMDLYTAHPDQVEPLPFRGMSGYPFLESEGYPRDAAHDEYREQWNVREVRGRFPRD